MDNGHHIPNLVEIETKIKIIKTQKKNMCMKWGLNFILAPILMLKKSFMLRY